MDFSHLPEPYHIEKFTSPTTPYVWSKPRNCKNVGIIAVGGGGAGGGAGSVGTTGTFRRGAAGGSAGGVVTGYLPGLIVPQNLYIYVGQGGTASTANGGSGVITRINYAPSLVAETNANIFSAGGGPGGASAGNNPGGPGNTIRNGILRGFLVSTVGRGILQGQGTSTTSIARVERSPVFFITGGQGGGCIDATNVAGPGGEWGSRPPMWTEYSGTSLTDGERGKDGDVVWVNDWLFNARGGTGGNANSAGIGGAGGTGGIGCGGGGAGAGSSSIAVGGAGGDGIVIIITW